MMKNIKDIVTVIIEEKVPVVTTGAGTPKHIMPYLKEAGVKVIPVVASVKHAQKMQELGVDAVVAEGSGRSITDVMERIRSGLLGNTEAIDFCRTA